MWMVTMCCQLTQLVFMALSCPAKHTPLDPTTAGVRHEGQASVRLPLPLVWWHHHSETHTELVVYLGTSHNNRTLGHGSFTQYYSVIDYMTEFCLICVGETFRYNIMWQWMTKKINISMSLTNYETKLKCELCLKSHTLSRYVFQIVITLTDKKVFSM